MALVVVMQAIAGCSYDMYKPDLPSHGPGHGHIRAEAGPIQRVLRVGHRGIVAGSFIEIGGPLRVEHGRPVPYKPIPLYGRVVARNQAGQVLADTVGKNGQFRMLLPPGTYRLTGYSPAVAGSCASEPIKVPARRQVVHVDVVCAAV